LDLTIESWSIDLKIGIIVEGSDQLDRYEDIWYVLRYLLKGLIGRGNQVVMFCEAQNLDAIKLYLDSVATIGGSMDFVLVGEDTISRNMQLDDSDSAAELLAENVLLAMVPIDIWFNPDPFWTALQYVPGPKLSWFNDFIFCDYPSSYAATDVHDLLVKSKYAAVYIDHFVCVSDYVMRKHAVGYCELPSEKLSMIANPPIDHEGMLDISICQFKSDRLLAQKFIHSSLKKTLPRWQGQLERSLFLHHVVNYPFASNDFIFVSTANLPHRNLITVARALNLLVRTEFFSISVFTTAIMNMMGDSDLELYLKTECLFGDYLSVGKLADLERAVLYILASVTIHPSPFEGTFPLPFAESVSVGTPCIIPFRQAYAHFIPKRYWSCVFYEDSPQALATRIRDIMANRADIAAEQLELLNFLRQATWDSVAAQYQNIFSGLLGRH
jgi:glycosyltransferase involved in cell wall biosynthesis